MSIYLHTRNFLIHNLGAWVIKYIPVGFFRPHLPRKFTIEATNSCNLRCRLCPTNTFAMSRQKGMMSMTNFKKIIDEIKDHVIRINFDFAGEPLCNLKIFQMIAYAKKRGIRTTYISTNAMFLGDHIDQVFTSSLDEITVCLDGASEKTHEFYRRGSNFDLIKSNIKKLVAKRKKLHKKKPLIELQFVVMKHNEKELDQIVVLAKQLKVDRLSLKTVSLGTRASFKEKLLRGKQFLPQNSFFSRYKSNSDLVVKQQLSLCDWPFRRGVIYWNGDVTTCCFDFDGAHVVGNIFQTGSFKKVWLSRKFAAIRKMVLTKKLPLCQGCTRTSDYGICLGKKDLVRNFRNLIEKNTVGK